MVALYHPLAVRRWATWRNAQRLIAALVLLSVLDAVPCVFEVALAQNPNRATGHLACIGVYKHVLQMVTLVLFTLLLNNSLPSVAVLLCSFIMSYKIKSLSSARRRLRPQFRVFGGFQPPLEIRVIHQNNTEGTHQILEVPRNVPRHAAGPPFHMQELKLAKSVLILTTLEALMHVAHGLIWSAFALQNILQASREVRGRLLSVGLLSSYTLVVIRLWNLYIYYFTIPAFRTELHRVLCRCCCARLRPDPAPVRQRADSSSRLSLAQIPRSPMSAPRYRAETFSSARSAHPVSTATGERESKL